MYLVLSLGVDYPSSLKASSEYFWCYLHVDIRGNDFVIEITAKEDQDISNIENEFENELLAQAVRFQVYNQTHVLREVLMARAMSSTITGDNTELTRDQLPNDLDQLGNILMDWFEKNEQ